MRAPSSSGGATLLIRAANRAWGLIVRPSSSEVPAASGNVKERGDETFARAQAAMAAGRVQLARAKDLVERTRDLVDGADQSSAPRPKKQDGEGPGRLVEKPLPQG